MSQPIPANPDTERAFLALLIMDNEAIGEAIERLPARALQGGLGPLFSEPANQAIFEQVMALYNAGRSVTTLVLRDALFRAGRLAQVGGEDYLARLNENVLVPEGACELADALVDYWRRRRGLAVADQMRAAIIQGRPMQDIATCVSHDAYEAAAEVRSSFFQSILETAHESIQFQCARKEDNRPGIMSGLAELDRMICGFRPGNLIILAARPSMGKTAMAGTIAFNAARAERALVPFHSLEMTKRELTDRILSQISGIPFGVLRENYPLTHFQKQALTEAEAMLAEVPLYLDDQTRMTVPQIKSKTLRLMTQHAGRCLVVVDYLGKVRPSDRYRGDRVREVSELACDFKAMAMELDVPVLLLAQLSRKNEDEKRMPDLRDLRDSGEIEQEADVVIFIHRERMKNDDAAKEATVIVAKQRNGPVGKVKIGFDGEHTVFRNLPRKGFIP